MYMEVLRSIEGIEIFPVVSLVLFVTFFGAMLIWTSRLTADTLREYAGMPLDEAGRDVPVGADGGTRDHSHTHGRRRS